MFNLDKKMENRLTISAAVIIAFIITVSIIYQNSTHYILGNSYRDVFFYLIESLRMSGVDISGYAYVNYLPPFIPFLTSILFRLGFVSHISIFVTSGVFFFIGIMGMFYLLRLRFNNFYAFFGAFLYATLSINIKWVGNGTLDIAFVALMLWALYFFIQGMEKNQKYFYLAFPLAVLSFFTKYTGALIVGVMLLYFMSRTNIAYNIKKYYKHIFGGVLAGFLTSIPFFAYFILNNIPMGFLNQASEVASESSITTTHAGHVVGNNLFFYINGLIYDISSTNYIIGILILAITIIGIILIIYMFFNTFKKSYLKIQNTKSSIYKWSVPAKLMYVLLIISFLLVLISFFTASLFPFYYSEIILFLGMYILAYSLTKIIINFEDVDNVWLSTYPYLAINIAMAGLFLVYLIFFTAHLTKADRYFTSMAPGFIFLIVLSVEILLNRINFKFKYIIPILMMILMLGVCVDYISGIHDDAFSIDENNVANWIECRDGVILSDRGPTYTWLLQKEVNYARNSGNITLLNQELLDNNARYYISNQHLNLTSYKLIKEVNGIKIYGLK